MGQKTSKGAVSIANDSSRIRLRGRHLKKRYSLNLSFYSKANLLQAKQVALSIEQDIALGTFDASLKKDDPKSSLSTGEKQFETILENRC